MPIFREQLELLEKSSPRLNTSGVVSYSVRKLDEPGLIIPSNIHVCTETDPARAVRDMLYAMYSGCSFATWLVPDSLFRRELKDDVTQAYKNGDPSFFDAFDKQEEHGLDNALLTTSGLAHDWLKASFDVFTPFCAAVGSQHGDTRLSGMDYRNKGYAKLNLHVDQDLLPVKVKPEHKDGHVLLKGEFHNCNIFTSVPDHPGMDPIKTLGYRLLWTQADDGVLVADNMDLEEYPATDDRRFNFINPHPVLYQAPAWSISLLPHFSHLHTSAIHSSPVSKDLDMHRMLWDRYLHASPEFSSEDYRQWVEEKGGPMPLFDIG